MVIQPPIRGRLKKMLLAIMVVLVHACALATDVSAAQQAIDEIVVTAARRPTTAQDLSTAVSVVGREQLRDQKLVTDALSLMTGVALQQTTPGQGSAIIRGLKGSSILHLVDGLRLNNAIFRSAPTQYLALVPSTAVERIEVLRGTPASLYGSDAVGGVVQVVSRVPAFTSAEVLQRGETSLAFGTADRERSFSAALDAGNRRVASSVSLEHLRTGDRRTGGGERIRPTAYEATSGRLALGYTPDALQSWFFDVQYYEQPETPRIDELVAGYGQSEPSASEFAYAPNRRVFAHARYARADGPLGLAWRTSIAWQRIDDDRTTSDFGSTTRRFENNRSDLAGVLVTASRSTRQFSWIAGAELYNDRVSSRRREQDGAGGQLVSVASRFPDGSRVRQAALFANAERALPGDQRVLAGLRASSFRVTLPGTQINVPSSLTATDLSGDIGWIYRLNDEWQLVANAGFGFRAPNVFDLGTLGARPGNRFNVPNTDLESEHVLQGDVGLRRYSGGVRLELMVYALRYEDRITSVLTGDVTADGRAVSRSENAARSSIHGVEFGARLQLSDSATAVAALNVTRGTQEVNGVVEPADRIPPVHGRAGIEVEVNDAFGFGGWLQFAAAQERLSSRDVSDPRINPDGTPAWATMAASLHWKTAHGWQVTLALDNILDKRYRVHGSGVDAPGRNLSLRLRWTW